MKMENKRPLILVTNDDGYRAKGIKSLIGYLSEFADVVCVAPVEQQSAKSMAITVNGPLRFTPMEDYGDTKVYTVNGTPVDCVKLAMQALFSERKPDMVVAGINHGSNASVNVNYSGTMGAVFEGCECGIPSVGYSLDNHASDADFEPCAPFIRRLTKMVLEHSLPQGVCLNVNFPRDVVPTEMRLARDCKGRWNEEYQRYEDPFGKEFYWLTGEFINEEPDAEDTDQWCLEHGVVSIVPTILDRTANAALVPQWLKEL
jgi:5'-nucleotidase